MKGKSTLITMEHSAAAPTTISDALRKLTYGFYILTTRKDASQLSTRQEDYLAAGTVCWVSQVSFEPHLVSVSIEKQSDLNETIQKSRAFALNVLGRKNLPLIDLFAHKTQVEDGAHQLNGHRFEDGQTGSPLLTETIASLECRLVEVVTLPGDHTLLVGEVVNAVIRDTQEPVLSDQDTPYKYGG